MLREIPIDGTPGPTLRYLSTNVAQSLPAVVTTIAGKITVGFLATVETNAVRFAIGGTVPTQGASPVGHALNVGDCLRLMGSTVVTTFQYISATAGASGVLQLTPFYTP
jgi:hypothetical protein